MNEAWARVVDLPGLEDNISPSNNISTLLRLVITEVSILTNSRLLGNDFKRIYSSYLDY